MYKVKIILLLSESFYHGVLCACTHDGHRDNGFIAINVAYPAASDITQSRLRIATGLNIRWPIEQAHVLEVPSRMYIQKDVRITRDPNFLISLIALHDTRAP